MARKKKAEEAGVGEKWAVPYADFLSLLLALFIALYAISSVNKSKLEALKIEFIKIFDNTSKPETIQPVITIPPNPGEESEQSDGNRVFQSQQSASSPSVENIAQLSDMIKEGGVLEQIEQGLTLKLPANLLFTQGSAEISNSDMMMYIRRIAQIIKNFPPQVKINIRGYTDNKPLPRNSNFSDHYNLAAGRAFTVMKELIQNGIPPEKMSFSSYGQYQPIAPNNSLENQAKNNRVEIFLSTDSDNIKEIKSILDQNEEQDKSKTP